MNFSMRFNVSESAEMCNVRAVCFLSKDGNFSLFCEISQIHTSSNY